MIGLTCSPRSSRVELHSLTLPGGVLGWLCCPKVPAALPADLS